MAAPRFYLVPKGDSTPSVKPESGPAPLGRHGRLFPHALSEIVAVLGAQGAVTYVLEGEEFVRHGMTGEPIAVEGTFKLDALDSRPLARALATQSVQYPQDLGFLAEDIRQVALLPLEHEQEPLGVVVVGWFRPVAPLSEEVVAELVARSSIALAADLRAEQRGVEFEELVEMSRLASIGLVSSSVAQELRGPACALALLVGELKSVIETPFVDRQDLLTIARDLDRCSERIVTMSQQLRSVGKRDRLAEEVDIGAVARDAAAIARIHAKPIAIEVVELYDSIEVRGKASQLGHLLLSLLLNAVEACRGRPDRQHRIELSVGFENSGVFVTVSDSGKGIDESIHDQIWKPFFSTKARGEGAGMGLFVAREIASAHGGTLGVTRNAWGGATFKLSLPRVEFSRASSVEIRKEPPLEKKNAKKLLFLDEDPILLKTFKRALRAHAVTIATTAEEAIHLFEAGHVFDVVIADVGLSESGGIRLHQWMEERFGQHAPPTLFVTGGVARSEDRAYLDACDAPCLIKPVSLPVLLDHVQLIVQDHEKTKL